MGLLANPYVALAIALFYVGSLTAVGVKAYKAGADHEVATQARIEKATEEARALALDKAAEKIAAIDVKQVTIRQKMETITREVPVYRDCKHSPDGLWLVNQALSPALGGAAGIHQGELPGSDAAGGPVVRSDEHQAD